MKKINSLISAAAVSALAVSAIPFSASAADGDVVYGTMNIPYADFYAAEFEGASNSFEVDAVSSATANKWKMNNTGAVGEDGTWQSGGLSAGTYYEANEDGNGGKILGVTYPVAVNAADVDFLTANYGFTALDSAPAAYKEVTVADGAITVSKLVDTDGEVEAGGNISLETTTSYGDYQLIVEGYPQDADVYGAIVKTADGNSYPMRALENLWRPKSEIAWSVGYVTATHGNNIDNPKYYPTNGATVTGVTFITLDGYRTVSGVNVYLPKMFTNGVKVEDSAAGSGSTTYDTSAFPADYEQTANVAEGFTAENGTINYPYPLTSVVISADFGTITEKTSTSCTFTDIENTSHVTITGKVSSEVLEEFMVFNDNEFYLYYYMGNTAQNLSLINVSKLAEELHDAKEEFRENANILEEVKGHATKFSRTIAKTQVSKAVESLVKQIKLRDVYTENMNENFLLPDPYFEGSKISFKGYNFAIFADSFKMFDEYSKRLYLLDIRYSEHYSELADENGDYNFSFDVYFTYDKRKELKTNVINPFSGDVTNLPDYDSKARLRIKVYGEKTINKINTPDGGENVYS